MAFALCFCGGPVADRDTFSSAASDWLSKATERRATIPSGWAVLHRARSSETASHVMRFLPTLAESGRPLFFHFAYFLFLSSLSSVILTFVLSNPAPIFTSIFMQPEDFVAIVAVVAVVAGLLGFSSIIQLGALISRFRTMGIDRIIIRTNNQPVPELAHGHLFLVCSDDGKLGNKEEGRSLCGPSTPACCCNLGVSMCAGLKRRGVKAAALHPTPLSLWFPCRSPLLQWRVC